MPSDDFIEAEVIEVDTKKPPTVEELNNHLVQKLDALILSIDVKTNPELVKVVADSVAKLNSSFKGNDIFAPKETEDERAERERAATLRQALGKE